MPTPCEALATAAEVQELRDQLNQLLGEKEDGTKATLFTKGTSGLVTAGLGVTTLLGMAKTTAPKAVTDIIFEKASTGTTWQQFASNNTGLKAKLGNGATKSLAGLNTVANTAGASASASTVAAGAGATAAASVALLGSLVSLAATLGLNKATVDIFDYRINQEAAGTQMALDAQNASMLRLYQNNKADIEKVNQEIAINNQRAAETNLNIQTIKTDLTYQQSRINEHNAKLEDAFTKIGQLQAENSQHVLKIDELTEELSNTKVNLTNQINTVNLQLQEALKVIESQKADIEKVNERITLFEARATSIEARLTEYEAKAAQMQQDFVELRAELDVIKELNPYLITEQPTEEEEFQGKVTYYETAQQTYERLFREHNSQSTEFKEWSVIVQQELNSEITERLTRYELQAKKHGFRGSQVDNIAATQTGVLEIAQKLSDPLADPDVVTGDDVRYQPKKFKDKLENLLKNFTPNKVNGTPP